MHYEDMLSRAENDSYNLKKHHKEEINALKADKRMVSVWLSPSLRKEKCKG